MDNYVIKPQEFRTKNFRDGFNATELKSFDTIPGIIIWSCIKAQHITDQHFDDLINGIARSSYIRNMSDDYLVFKEKLPFSLDGFSIDDNSFWLMIYRLLQNPSLFTFEINGKVHSLNNETMKLFKPENYI